ncbi:PITH domain-containing protein 1 [Choanephora cucurbitarum]|uniref:PITH domain-containing protein 1 n=1 Tax=Choanephora cucurbitarum TaxID=101091 RepID=A0A1C7NHE9_9FUNG|nr:PITH domain-containing protein 1 [Choanephora cucurbitarum]
MSHCHDEHCDHDHDDLPESGEQFLLYSKIDIDNVSCLNEAEPNSGKKVIRPWNERMDNDKFLESDADEQLIVHVPFTGIVKLRSICLRTDRTDAAPSKMKVFINRDDVDFDVAESYTATQEFDLVENSDQVVEYGVKMTKFSNVRSITLFFPENFGEERSVIRYIGFKGEWSEMKRDPIITIYEASANPADHKIPGASNTMGHSVQ